jgi:hypothetical protein
MASTVCASPEAFMTQRFSIVIRGELKFDQGK